MALRRETAAVSEGAPAHFALASHYDASGDISGFNPGDALAYWTVRDAASDDYDGGGASVADDVDYVLGSQYCEAAVNSTGASAFIRAHGSTWWPASLLVLRASEMPPATFGYFLVADQTGFVMNPGGSQGNLCLGGAIGRFSAPGQIPNSGFGGWIELAIDPTNLPSPVGPVTAVPGETWHFQCWFRDANPAVTSNFTLPTSITLQ